MNAPASAPRREAYLQIVTKQGQTLGPFAIFISFYDTKVLLAC